MGKMPWTYIQGQEREQVRLESIESYVEEYREGRVIDLIIDKMDIESQFPYGSSELDIFVKFLLIIIHMEK